MGQTIGTPKYPCSTENDPLNKIAASPNYLHYPFHKKISTFIPYFSGQ
jgi:hypothetical protein